jgi:transposase InsO family protein
MLIFMRPRSTRASQSEASECSSTRRARTTNASSRRWCLSSRVSAGSRPTLALLAARSTDNGSCYKSRLFTQTQTTAGIAHKKIRPYRPQANGKVERFNRTLLNEWAYLRPYTSSRERTEALAGFIHNYNHHRCHTALGGHPPISRVNNAVGQYT